MHGVHPTLSAARGEELHNPAGPGSEPAALRRPRYPNDTGADHIAHRWPTLSQALGRYTERTADAFSQLAYDHVRAGLIRRTDRLRLSAAALNLGIRDFDAQLLIACAIRRWAIDHRAENIGGGKGATVGPEEEPAGVGAIGRGAGHCGGDRHRSFVEVAGVGL